MNTASRHTEVCQSCGAVGYGNATCSACIKEWPRLGFDEEYVARLLDIIGDRAPEPPFGTTFH